MSWCSYLFSFIFLNFCILSFVNSSIIQTSLGPVEGKDVGSYRLFKKIPFAKPPIGKLRFQKPNPADPWNDVLNAKEYGPACMSNSSVTKTLQKWIDEDCLHINIFTSEQCLKTKNCPVVNYFHGGALHYDSAVMFNDTFILNSFVSHNIVFVIPAFRLGIFSHFVVEDQSIAPNNLALFDILLAMEFVKSDIRSFGGDNNKVTLLGNSFGGTISAILSFSTEVNNDLSLFQKYIAMSAPSNFDTLEYQIERTIRFAGHANCLPENSEGKLTQKQKDTYMRDCLQKVDSMEMLKIQRNIEDAGFPTYGGAVLRLPIFQEVPEQQFLDNPKNVSALTGCTKYEVLNFESYDDIGISLGFENPKEVDEKYANDRKNKKLGFEEEIRDETQEMFVQTWTRVKKLREKRIPAYLYEYAYPKHSDHAEDLFYIMGVHPFEQDENEKKLGDYYRNMFINFIKTGNPGKDVEMVNLENYSFFEVYWNETSGERPQMKNNFEKKIVDYWTKEMVEFDRTITDSKRNPHGRQPSVRSFKQQIGYNSFPFSIIFMLFIPFITGFLIAKYCCTGSEKHLYIQLDGNDYPIKA